MPNANSKNYEKGEDDVSIFVSQASRIIKMLKGELSLLEEKPDNNKPVQIITQAFVNLKEVATRIGLRNISKLLQEINLFLSTIQETKFSTKKINEFTNIMLEFQTMLKGIVKRVKEGRLKDIKETLNKELKVKLNEFIGDYEITLVEPIPPKKLKTIIQEKGHNFYRIELTLHQTSILKKVRLHLIFEELNKYGSTCWSIPSPELLEKGQFGLDLEIYYISEKKLKKMTNILASIIGLSFKNIAEIEPTLFYNIVSSAMHKWERQKQSTLAPTMPEIFPKIIFTNPIGLKRNSIITVPNKQFLNLILRGQHEVIFSCYKTALNNRLFILYIVKDGIFFITESSDFKIFEKHYQIKKKGFSSFYDFLDANKYGINENLEYFEFKESNFFGPYIRAYDEYLKAREGGFTYNHEYKQAMTLSFTTKEEFDSFINLKKKK